MQIYKNTFLHHNPTAPHNMDISHSKHSQHSQQPQHPYNPYLHQDQHHSQCFFYTLQPQSPTTPKSSPCSTSNDSPAPQDMFVALERLLLGISPFPPSIPNLAQPTCPSLDDQAMAKLSSSPSSSLSSSPEHAPSPVPSIVLNEQSFGALEKHYSERRQQPCNQDGSIHSGRSISPPASPFSNTSSSPIMAVDNSHDLPYWSPSTPTLQVDHQWSNHSSPLIQSQQKSTSWGYSLFDQMNTPLDVCDLDNSMAFSSSQHTQALRQQKQQKQQKQQLFPHLSQLEYPGQPNYPPAYSHYNNNNTTAANTLGILPLNARRAARTPPRRRISSELSGIRTYESTAYRDHYTDRNATASTFSSSPSSSNTNNNGNSNNNSSSSNTGSTSGANANAKSGNTQTHNHNHTNSSTTSAGIRGAVTRGTPRSYPCPTCMRPFPTRTQLKSHMAIHIDNFPFPCLYAGCDLHFKRKHDLRRHIDAKHALIKKYLCSGGCGEGFGRRDQMVRHLRRGVCGHVPLTE